MILYNIFCIPFLVSQFLHLNRKKPSYFTCKLELLLHVLKSLHQGKGKQFEIKHYENIS